MAYAHPLPGLGVGKVDRNQRFLRAASAPPDVQRLKEMLRPLDPKECKKIRDTARKDWRDEIERSDHSVTTYSGLHAEKLLDQPTRQLVRPSSPTRLNKPHPPGVFLVTRLKNIQGCFKPEAAATPRYGENGQDNLERYIQENRQKIAIAMGHHPRPVRPQTADAIATNKAREKITTIMGQVPGQATEAWIKLSNDKDRREILHVIDEAAQKTKQNDFSREQEKRRRLRRRQQIVSLRQIAGKQEKETERIYSSNRWLKPAGREENDAVTRLIEAFRSAPKRQIPMKGPHFHITDYSTMFASPSKPPRYDFQIHPEWHTPWHKQYEKQNIVTA
uniref:uncharacterized protein LOC120330021 n=1 Tax=Styela clava TaxID=7725 RepID=UPI00193A2426|nr:uncharacterized protein LOC120330021 [Styela clava]